MMLPLQTLVNIEPPDFDIKYSDKILFIGSCFTDNMGQKLQKLKFDVDVNPFGVLYNPASVSQAINLLSDKKAFLETELQFRNELWFSFHHHTSFSRSNKHDCLEAINKSFAKAKSHLEKIDYVVVTLGTSWAYRNKESGNIVANCHKIRPNEFNREFLDTENSVVIISEAIKNVLRLRPNAKFIFTISPIRHWKDGAVENMRSKASLSLAIKELEAKFPNLYYFPVYEIFMDELRDYRFYASDMLHPSGFAIEYIWKYFQKTFFNTATTALAERVHKINKSLEHRPTNTSTQSHQKFTDTLKKKIEELTKEHPYLSFD